MLALNSWQSFCPSLLSSGFASMHQHTQLWKGVFHLKGNYYSFHFGFLGEGNKIDSAQLQSLWSKVNIHRIQFMKTNGFLQTVMSLNWGKIHQAQRGMVKHQKLQNRKKAISIVGNNTPNRQEIVIVGILTRSSWRVLIKMEQQPMQCWGSSIIIIY